MQVTTNSRAVVRGVTKFSSILSVFFIVLFSASILFSPIYAGAQTPAYTGGGLVQCGNGVNGGLVSGGASTNNADDAGLAVGQQSCGFPQFMDLLARIINFLLFLVAPTIAVCVILYAGILVLTSAGSAEKISQAKSMFFKAVIGMVIAMAAWIIVKFIYDTLGYNITDFAHFY